MAETIQGGLVVARVKIGCSDLVIAVSPNNGGQIGGCFGWDRLLSTPAVLEDLVLGLYPRTERPTGSPELRAPGFESLDRDAECVFRAIQGKAVGFGIISQLAIRDEQRRRCLWRMHVRAYFPPLGRPVRAAAVPFTSVAILVVVAGLFALSRIHPNSIEVAIGAHQIGAGECWLKHSQFPFDEAAARQVRMPFIAEDRGKEIGRARFAEPPSTGQGHDQRKRQGYPSIHGRIAS